MLPTTDQIEAVSQIPVLILAMVVVLMALTLMLPIIRSLYSKQASQDESTKSLFGMIAQRDLQFQRLTEIIAEQAEVYKTLVVPIQKFVEEHSQSVLDQIARNEVNRKIFYDDLVKLTKDSEHQHQVLDQIQNEFGSRLERIEQATLNVGSNLMLPIENRVEPPNGD